MTTLSKNVTRKTAKLVQGRAVVITLAPCGSAAECRIGLRLAGKRVQYVLALSDVYRYAALAFGQKEARAKREARRAGIRWQVARKTFIRENSI